MTDDTQPEALRALAEAAKWTGKWYDAGCNTVHCTYDKEDSILHHEIARPVPFGVSGYIAAAHPQAVIALLDRIAELEAQIEALSGVQALSAGPAGWKLVPVNPTPEMWKAAKSVPDPKPTIPAALRVGLGCNARSIPHTPSRAASPARRGLCGAA